MLYMTCAGTCCLLCFCVLAISFFAPQNRPLVLTTQVAPLLLLLLPLLLLAHSATEGSGFIAGRWCSAPACALERARTAQATPHVIRQNHKSKFQSQKSKLKLKLKVCKVKAKGQKPEPKVHRQTVRRRRTCTDAPLAVLSLDLG
eukprot:947584-Rhodomonas_salina.1